MPKSNTYSRLFRGKLRRWLLEGSPQHQEGFYEPEMPQSSTQHHTHPWYKVMCLTGVDYFSTLGYQPGIAALAAGSVAPLATFVLVLITLFGALPMYRRVADESPHGDGSISMLERLLAGWTGKFVVLALIGFVATGFIITITLSAADAGKHLVENPLLPSWLDNQVFLTLFLVIMLGAVFLKGFKEAIGIAVVLVIAYLGLSAVVIAKGFQLIAQNPSVLSDWASRVHFDFTSTGAIIFFALSVFPALALGLSGFETGVVVMPLVEGDPSDNVNRPLGRIRNSRKLLTTAALIMSVMLMTSSVVTTALIPPTEFYPTTDKVTETFSLDEIKNGTAKIDVSLSGKSSIRKNFDVPIGEKMGAYEEHLEVPGLGPIVVGIEAKEVDDGIEVSVIKHHGDANGRALAYLAHEKMGNIFGTIYDISTILILWFAGSSAMAGLLNITPRYLPRYGMAPTWAGATRPLVLIFTGVCILVTVLFKADVDAQAGAYATGVIALMTSAAIAVMLSAFRKKETGWGIGFALIGLIFVYTLLKTIVEAPSGIQIASIFIASIILISLASRVYRSTELRVDHIEIDEEARKIIENLSNQGEVRFIANHRDAGDGFEYNLKEQDVRVRTHIPSKEPIAFLEVFVPDASDFSDVLKVRGVEVGEHRILRVQGTSVPNSIAALLLHIRDDTKKVPHIYFEWGERSPIQSALQFVILGLGDVPTTTHEILRQAERNIGKRPVCHVGG